MAKPKIRFVCQSCGYVTAKMVGKVSGMWSMGQLCRRNGRA